MAQTPRVPYATSVPSIEQSFYHLFDMLRAHDEIGDLRELSRVRMVRTIDCFG